MAAQDASTPTRSPGAFSNRFVLGGQAAAAATADDVGPLWPQAGTPPPGIQTGTAPASIPIHSTPGAASHLGDPAQDQTPSQVAEVERLKAQIEAMVASMRQLSDQVEKLMAAPAPPMAAPAPASTPQPQPQSEPPDAWQGSWQRYQQAQQAGNTAAAQPCAAAPPLRPVNPQDVEKSEK